VLHLHPPTIHIRQTPAYVFCTFDAGIQQSGVVTCTQEKNIILLESVHQESSRVGYHEVLFQVEKNKSPEPRAKKAANRLGTSLQNSVWCHHSLHGSAELL